VIEHYVQGWDPTAFLAVTVVLQAAAVAACWVPVRRATAIEPVSTLTVDAC
jgi:ABC-type lipoprotein release transport system permease subunit